MVVVGYNKINGTLELFEENNGQIYHKWQIKPELRWNDRWEPLSDLGTVCSNCSIQSLDVGENLSGTLEVFLQAGTRNDYPIIYHKWQQTPAGAWHTKWEVLDSFPLNTRLLDPVVARNEPKGTLEVFAVGVTQATYSNIYHIWQLNADGAWHTKWESLGSPQRIIIGPVKVIRNEPKGTLEVFALAYDGSSNSQLYHLWQLEPSGIWHDKWESLGSPENKGISSFSVGRNKNGTLEAFVICSNMVYHRWQKSSSGPWYESWQSLGSPLNGASLPVNPAVGYNKFDGTLEVFVLAVEPISGNDVVYHRWQQSASGTWNPNWESLGSPPGIPNPGELTSYRAPIIGQNEDGRLEIFMVSVSSSSQQLQVYHRWQQRQDVQLPRPWSSEWQSLGYPSIVPDSTYDYTSVYGKLRASVLSRHFALNKYFRTNVLFANNVLNTNYSIGDLLSKDPSTQVIERWKINEIDSHDDNPLMMTGMLLTSLAVEAHLGSEYALRIIKKALFALSTLYKFQGNNFDGYILRGDPVTRIDRWMIETNKKYSGRFLIDSNNNYMFCAPTTDPRYKRFVPKATEGGNDKEHGDWYNWAWYFRHNEPSTDELVGLVAGYSMVYLLVQDEQIRTIVREQVTKLADYLNAHGYMLVRPIGGFSNRGHSGMTPALEYPFNRLFYRITGKSYSSNVSFEDVMKKANVWKCLEGPTNWYTIGGVALTVIIPILRPILASTGLLTLIAANTPITPIQLARALAINNTKICFDTTLRDEFVSAYLLKQIGDRIRRFEIFMNGVPLIPISIATQKDSNWAVGFLPFIGITGLDDDQTVVKNAYLNWLKARRSFNSTNATVGDFDNWGERSCFASAIALLFSGDIKEEEVLVSRLKKSYDAIHGKYNDDLPILLNSDGKIVEPALVILGKNEQTRKDNPYDPSALDYMAGLALAWLYAKRKAAKGTPVTTKDFPKVPTNLDGSLLKVVIPKEIWPHYKTNNIDFRIEDIQNTKDIDKTKDADLFSNNAPEKSPVPVPIVLPIIDTNRAPDIDAIKTINENNSDVYTGINLKSGDIYEFSEIKGTIWAGVALTGRNGPDGWIDRVDYDVKFPLHGGMDPVNAHPFCLLGKLKTYFFIGSRGRGKERFIYPRYQDIQGTLPDGNPADGMPLYLRINDDSPGNGNGNFSCRIRVWQDPVNK
jgi:hypothetical protein